MRMFGTSDCFYFPSTVNSNTLVNTNIHLPNIQFTEFVHCGEIIYIYIVMNQSCSYERSN